MKRVFITITTVLLAAFAASAQDMSATTETYNNGAAALSNGDYDSALAYFKEALTMAETCGEEGAEVVANSKDIIPQIMLQQSKELLKDGKYPEAINSLNETLSVAQEYASDAVVADVNELLPQVKMQQAGSYLNNKQFAEAAAAYEEVLADNPTNGIAALRLGMAYGQTGEVDKAEAAYLKAVECGQEKAAKKQLSALFVKAAAKNLKAKNYQEAINEAVKSYDYLENATAMKVAGTAASALKQNEKAIEYLSKYLELSPNANDAAQMAYTVAATAQQMGKKDVAKEYYTKILSDAKFGEVAKQQLVALSK